MLHLCRLNSLNPLTWARQGFHMGSCGHAARVCRHCKYVTTYVSVCIIINLASLRTKCLHLLSKGHWNLLTVCSAAWIATRFDHGCIDVSRCRPGVSTGGWRWRRMVCRTTSHIGCPQLMDSAWLTSWTSLRVEPCPVVNTTIYLMYSLHAQYDSKS